MQCQTSRDYAMQPAIRSGSNTMYSLGFAIVFVAISSINGIAAGPLVAGIAKVDITKREAGPVNDPLYVKILVLKDDDSTVVLGTVDAVAIGEIGHIKNSYLPNVRARLQSEHQIPAESFIVNASHCHGVVCDDIEDRTIEAVQLALATLTPVTVGAGAGHENRIMENRRLRLKNGRELDVRHAYSLPPDDEVESVGPIDPQIGVLRINRLSGETLAVVYNFACHPIQGVPNGGNTADLVGFASKVIEDNLSPGAMAFFIQGCGGDINPVLYKDVNHPRDAEPHGTKLGLSTLQAVRSIDCKTNEGMRLTTAFIELPRANLAERILDLETEQKRLVTSLQGTSLNLKTFLPLVAKYRMDPEHPAYYSHRYLQEQAIGKEDLRRMDAENLKNMNAYIHNIHTMENLSRVQTNLELLRMHERQNAAAAGRTIRVEISALRIGDFRWITFPGELTVQIGLNIKSQAPYPNTFVSGYTNGYIYYAPTADQLRNLGGAQEDSDCILAPEWQEIFETKALSMLNELR